MTTVPPDFYARARIEICTWTPLQEAPLRPPPERLLQQLWRHQCLRRDELQTLDGRPVRVLHPGFWNREAGPDFRQAVIRIGDTPARTGDVEVDLEVEGWRHHHHADNPAYGQVLLQVVWSDAPAAGRLPVLPLRPYLDRPWGELGPWLEEQTADTVPLEVLGRCCGPLRSLPQETVMALLNQAAAVRLRRKAGEFAVRARHAGWEQALWEGLLGGLGYKPNVWPFRYLAERFGRERPEARTDVPTDLVAWEARLLGWAGLLPHDPPRPAAGYVRRLWDCWWRERDRWADEILPSRLWRPAGIRPANHPQRRLALAARWWADGTLPARLQTWLDTSPRRPSGEAELLGLLVPPVEPDTFWACHWTLRSPATPHPHPLLGRARATDLVINGVLPWLHALAAASGNSVRLAEVERRYFAWPSAQDNARLRLCRQRLFAGARQPGPPRAATQQGLLQIAGDFCGSAGPLCSGCRFPSLVDELRRTPVPRQAEPAKEPLESQSSRR